MSCNPMADDQQPFSPVPEVFRFSPQTHQAHRIKWRAWGNAAFDEAIHRDKPIFLLLSSIWCQGCHLMDKTTLSEARVIDVINTDYVPIRVDCDLRPDINQRYNQNGFPSVLLLSGEGEILWGSVYMPPTKLLYYLGYMRRYYVENHYTIAALVHPLYDRRRTVALTQLPDAATIVLQDVPALAMNVLRDLYDAENGGFTIHQSVKFPHPDALEFLLISHESDDSAKVCYSLNQMRDGGLWDHEAGGFFRYSSANDWSMPHTEKLLHENAAMLRLLLLTAQATGDMQWKQLARQLISYVNMTLWQSDTGAFSGSQCADEEYYEPGLYSRASRTHPLVDVVIYTDWNAQMISSYLLAANVLDDISLRKKALRALDYLCEHVFSAQGCMFHYTMEGRSFLPGWLSDQVWMMQALLDAYDSCREARYLETAHALMQFISEELLDSQNGLAYDCPNDLQALGRLALHEQPLIENVLLALCDFRMAKNNRDSHFHELALQILSACLSKYQHTGIHGVFYAHVVALASEQKWL